MEELEKNETSTQAEENTVSLASAQALADALAKIEAYTPTTWVDNSSPDIDAEHLNKPEQAIKRVTDALNSAVDVIKDLQSQVTKNAGDISTVNNNLSNGSVLANFSSMKDNEANFCNGYNYANGRFCFNYRGAKSKITDYVFGDGLGTGGTVKKLSDLATKDDLPQSGRTPGIDCVSNTVTEFRVTFPKVFSKTPAVIVTPSSGSPEINGVPKYSAWNVTTTGFTIRIYNDDSEQRSPAFYWIAMAQS